MKIHPQDWLLPESGRERETIEWSQHRHYNANDLQSPRVLMIGDSICDANHSGVRTALGSKLNLSFWASSKCVTDRDYLPELDFVLGSWPYTLILFNNGLHSLVSDSGEWELFYRNTIRFIRHGLPETKLSIVTATPLKTKEKTERARALNAIALRIAEEERLAVVDLFRLMEPLDRESYWSDVYHFRPDGSSMQVEALVRHIVAELQCSDRAGILQQHSTETGPQGLL